METYNELSLEKRVEMQQRGYARGYLAETVCRANRRFRLCEFAL